MVLVIAIVLVIVLVIVNVIINILVFRLSLGIQKITCARLSVEDLL